jgi:glycine/serine hydroxymethyltransferase
MRAIGEIITTAIRQRADAAQLVALRERVAELCENFPLYEGTPLYGTASA